MLFMANAPLSNCERGNDPRRHRDQLRAQLPLHRALKCRARTRSGQPCQAPAMPNGRCRMHGGMSPGAPKSNKNSLKHGRYAAEAIERRRKISGLIGAMKALAKASE